MNRRKDSRVVEVLDIFDRTAAHKLSLCGFMSSVVDTGIDRFAIPGGWTTAGVRAVLAAHLLLHVR